MKTDQLKRRIEKLNPTNTSNKDVENLEKQAYWSWIFRHLTRQEEDELVALIKQEMRTTEPKEISEIQHAGFKLLSVAEQRSIKQPIVAKEVFMKHYLRTHKIQTHPPSEAEIHELNESNTWLEQHSYFNPENSKPDPPKISR